MNPGNSKHIQKSGDAAQFGRTHWTQVIRAAEPANEGFDAALQELCQTYWYPLYSFVRRSGHSAHDAEDLTQAFFARLLEKNYIAAADQAKGRFRTFLIVALKRFMANEWDRNHAQKRGGFATIVAIDHDLAETRYDAESPAGGQPDVLLDRQWAMVLLDQVMKRLEAEYQRSDRGILFGHLRATLVPAGMAKPYKEIGAKLGTSEAAVKMAAQRLRTRYRELLREEIARTVESPEDIENEIRHLFSVFSG